jgi:hypothetical protein
MSIGAFSQFQLSNFQAEVLGKGLARPNRFEVIIPRPSIINRRAQQIGFNGAIVGGERIGTARIPPQRISILCEQSAFPLFNINVKPYRIYGTPYQRPVTSDYGGDGLPMTFHVDREMTVKRFFEDWARFIIDRESFNVAFQDQYAVDIEVYQLDEFNRRTYGVKMIDAFPRSLNQMELNMNAQNQTHRLIVLFSYRKWIYVGESPTTKSLEVKGDKVTQHIMGETVITRTETELGVTELFETTSSPRKSSHPLYSGI